MTEFVSPGNAIEGDAIKGTSRDPLRNRGIARDRSPQRLWKFTASFNVRSEIVSTINGEPTIIKDAATGQGDRIIGESVIILTETPKPALALIPGSGKHRTNSWHFNQHTAAEIVSIRQDISDAIAKR